MKTISEIIGGAQVLLPLEYQIQDSFSSSVKVAHPFIMMAYIV